MSDPTPTREEREEARNIWPSCYGCAPFNETITHGTNTTTTSRCCEFHEKLARALAEQWERDATIVTHTCPRFERHGNAEVCVVCNSFAAAIRAQEASRE